MHYYVAGINASGKTTLLNAVSKQTGMPVVGGTEELMKALGVADREGLNALDQDKVQAKWGETAEKLLRKFGRKPFLLDAHILYLAKGKIVHRDGPWVGGYDALVMIKAAPAAIFSRLEHGARDPELFTLDFGNEAKLTLLADYQEQTEIIVKSLAQKYGLPMKIIENQDLDTAVSEFIAFTKSVDSLTAENDGN